MSFFSFTNLSSSKVGHDSNLTFTFSTTIRLYVLNTQKSSKTVFLKNPDTLEILPLLSGQGTEIYFHF